MPKNIFDFEDTQEKVQEKITAESCQNFDRESIEKTIKHYQDFSQDELLSELFRVASIEKENGTLTKERLNDIKSTILPYLNENQIDFLNKLIEKLNV